MDSIIDLLEWLISTPLLCCGWIIIGALAGAFARRIMGAKDKPLWNDMLLGLVGAIIGGFLTSLFSVDTGQAGNNALMNLLVTFIVATGGAAGLIFIGRKIFGDERKRRRKR